MTFDAWACGDLERATSGSVLPKGFVSTVNGRPWTGTSRAARLASRAGDRRPHEWFVTRPEDRCSSTRDRMAKPDRPVVSRGPGVSTKIVDLLSASRSEAPGPDGLAWSWTIGSTSTSSTAAPEGYAASSITVTSGSTSRGPATCRSCRGGHAWFNGASSAALDLRRPGRRVRAGARRASAAKATLPRRSRGDGRGGPRRWSFPKDGGDGRPRASRATAPSPAPGAIVETVGTTDAAGVCGGGPTRRPMSTAYPESVSGRRLAPPRPDPAARSGRSTPKHATRVGHRSAGGLWTIGGGTAGLSQPWCRG